MRSIHRERDAKQTGPISGGRVRTYYSGGRCRRPLGRRGPYHRKFLMPDETRETGRTDRPGSQRLQSGEDGSRVLDDDVDFYDDEPATRGGSAISPPTAPGPDPAP